jgi:hypothetical protein
MADEEDWYVVDTNVIAVANGEAGHVGDECIATCAEFLRFVQSSGNIVVIDSPGDILREYLRHRTDGQPGVGERFIRWILQVRADPEHCKVVDITASVSASGRPTFEEYPDSQELDLFDQDDKKFVAVAAATDGRATIVNATDHDWADYAEALKRVNVSVMCICPAVVAC